MLLQIFNQVELPARGLVCVMLSDVYWALTCIFSLGPDSSPREGQRLLSLALRSYAVIKAHFIDQATEIQKKSLGVSGFANQSGC